MAAVDSNKSKKKNKKAKGSNKTWETFKLKASLLRIWFFKNLKTFLLIALLVYLITILTGNATGGFLFGGLSEKIASVTSASTVGDIIMNVLAVILSIGTTMGLFYKKVRGIRLQDIKSKKLKLALIGAGLYFNQDGKLVKRVEQIMQVDVDNDGKINKTPVDEVNQVVKDFNIIKGTVDAFSELKTILTSKIETQEDYRDLIQEAELKDTKDAFDELDGKVTLPSISVTLDNVTIGTDPDVIADNNDAIDLNEATIELPALITDEITNEDDQTSSDDNVVIDEIVESEPIMDQDISETITREQAVSIIESKSEDDINISDEILDSALSFQIIENNTDSAIADAAVNDAINSNENKPLTDVVDSSDHEKKLTDDWSNVSDYHKKKIFNFTVIVKFCRYITDGIKHFWKKIFKKRSKTVDEIVAELPITDQEVQDQDIILSNSDKLDVQIIVNENAIKLEADEAAELKRKQHEDNIANKLVAESKPITQTNSEAEIAIKNAAATERAQKALERLLK